MVLVSLAAVVVALFTRLELRSYKKHNTQRVDALFKMIKDHNDASRSMLDTLKQLFESDQEIRKTVLDLYRHTRQNLEFANNVRKHVDTLEASIRLSRLSNQPVNEVKPL